MSIENHCHSFIKWPLAFFIGILICSGSTLIAQDRESSAVSIAVGGGIGYGMVENENEPNYNLNVNSGEVLVNVKFSEKYGLATGIGLNELSGNGFGSQGNFFHERTTIDIPLMITMDVFLSENFRVFIGLGLYGQHILEDEYQFLSVSQENVYEGWNFGFQTGVSLLYSISDQFSAGVTVSGQSDFTSFDSSIESGIENSQKMKNLSTVGFLFVWDL